MLHIIAIFLCAAMLSGCVAAAAAGAAGAGYVAADQLGKARQSKRDQFKREATLAARQGAAAQRQRSLNSDERTALTINKHFMSGGLTKVLAINVHVQNGVVTLFGNVPSQGVADRAIAIARTTPGVKQVVSRLVVFEMRITPANR